jgi:hypothetical protein
MNADNPNANNFVDATLIPIALAARSFVRTARQRAGRAASDDGQYREDGSVAMATRPNGRG